MFIELMKPYCENCIFLGSLSSAVATLHKNDILHSLISFLQHYSFSLFEPQFSHLSLANR